MSAVLEQSGEDLEALFDSISDARLAEVAATPALTKQERAESITSVKHSADSDEATQDAYAIFERIGSLTRNLHDALKQLGYDKQVEDAVGVLPDARARLGYIAKLTGQAAETALNKSEAGVELQQKVLNGAEGLAAQWDDVFAGKLGVDQFRAHAEQTRTFLKQLPSHANETSALFSDIMLAQDFHDLTGQVVNKIVVVAENLETQLVKLLLDCTPPDKRTTRETEWLSGPVIDSTGRDDVVSSQAQVDDLLASLGF